MTRRTLLSLAAAAAAPVALERNAGPGRLRPALCAYSYRRQLQSKALTYNDLVRLAVEWGIDGLDLTVYWFPDTSDTFLLPLRRQAYRAGIEIYSISVRSETTRPTTELRAAEVENLKKWADVAARLGAGHMRVFGGAVPKEATEDQAAEWAVEVLRRAGEYAGSRGIILGLENHGGITARAERVLDIVKRVDSPWVAVNLDSGNFKERHYEQFEMLAPYAANVQFKIEPSDWARFAAILRKAGYRGYVALEYEGKEDATTAVPRHIAELKKVVV